MNLEKRIQGIQKEVRAMFFADLRLACTMQDCSCGNAVDAPFNRKVMDGDRVRAMIRKVEGRDRELTALDVAMNAFCKDAAEIIDQIGKKRGFRTVYAVEALRFIAEKELVAEAEKLDAENKARLRQTLEANILSRFDIDDDDESADEGAAVELPGRGAPGPHDKRASRGDAPRHQPKPTHRAGQDGDEGSSLALPPATSGLDLAKPGDPCVPATPRGTKKVDPKKAAKANPAEPPAGPSSNGTAPHQSEEHAAQ